MPRLQTGIGVISGTIDANTYVVSFSSRPIIASWSGVYNLVENDHVIIQKVDVSKNAHIISVCFGDDLEGRPGGQQPIS